MEEGTSLSREKFGFNMFVILLLLLTNLEVVIGQNCSRPDVEGSPISDGRLPQLNPDQLQYIENESVTFHCSESNDDIFGPPKVVCESDGNWSIDLFPKCLAMCSDPGSPEGGNKTGTSEYTPHSVVNFVCNQQSDTLLGSDTITCIDGQWDGDVPECLSGCSDPGTPSNGTQFKTDTSFKHGGTVNFTCDEGYFRVGNEALYCTSGKWSGDIPSCEDMNECSSEPCFNGAECVNQVNMYKCQCVTGFEGTNCEDVVSTVKTTTLATTAPTTSSSTESTTASTSKAPKRTTEVSTTGEDITNSPKSTSAVTAGTTTYLSYMTSTEGRTMTKSSAVSTYSTAVKAATTGKSTLSHQIATALWSCQLHRSVGSTQPTVSLASTTEQVSTPSKSITTAESTGPIAETQRSTESPQSNIPPGPTSQTTVMITTGMTTTVDSAPTQQDTDTPTVSTNPLSGTTEKMSTLSHSITTAESTGPVTETQGSTESPQSTLPPAPTSQTTVMITTGMTTTVDSAPTQQDTDTQTVSTNPLSGTTEKMSPPSDSITTVESTGSVTETQRSTESPQSTLPPAPTSQTTVMITTGMTTTVDTAPTQLQDTDTSTVSTNPLSGTTEKMSTLSHSITTADSTGPVTETQGSTESPQSTLPPAPTSQTTVMITTGMTTTVDSAPTQQDTDTQTVSTNPLSGTTEKVSMPSHSITTAESTRPVTETQRSTESSPSTLPPAGTTKEQTPTHNVQTTVGSTQVQSSTTLSTTVQGGTVGTTHPQSATLSVMPTTTKASTTKEHKTLTYDDETTVGSTLAKSSTVAGISITVQAGTTKEQLPTQDIETTVGSIPAQNSVALSTTLQSGTTKEQTPKEDAESTVGSTQVQSSTVSGTSTTIQAGITKEQTSTPNVETTSVRSTQTQSSTVSTTKCIDDPCDSNTQYCVDNTTGYNCRCKATTRRKDNDCLLVKTFRGGFKMKDVNFSDDLNDPDSSKYKSLVTTVTTKVDTLMISINNLYVTSDILGFKPGSVVVDFISSFDVEAAVTTEDIENRFVVEANSTNGVFSNFAIDEMSFIEFNDTVCVIPGGHDCSEDASCVNTSDGSFTCVCISGYEDESKYDTRPGRQCIVSMIQDHSTFFTPIVITSIVVAGVLFLSLFLFVAHYCLLSRKDATVVRVPFEEDFHSAVHPLVDPGVHHNMSHQMYEYTSTLQVEDDIRRVDCPSDKVDDGNGSTLAIPKYGAESYVEDESVDNRLDSLLRQVKQSSMLMQTGEPIHDMSRSPEISSDRLETRSTDNEFMRPYIATGDEEQYLQRRDYEGRRRDIPLRDYTEDYYRPPRTQGNYILPDIRTRLNNLPYQIPRPSTETLP